MTAKQNDDSAIFMPYDIRTALGVPKHGKLDFCVDKAGCWAKLCWYVGSPDPAVHIPAWIAIVGIVLAIVGLIVGVMSVV